MSELREDVVARLVKAADPERAEGQQAYMKSALPFFGVRVTEARKIAIAAAKDHPFTDRAAWEDGVLELWRAAEHREERYAAIDIAHHRPYRQWLDAEAVPMIEEMIVTGAWWDHVDAMAPNHVATMLRNSPEEMRWQLWEWALDDRQREGSIWRRRTAIICQLKAGETTDLDLMFHAIEASIDDTEFFLRKAIGWALRQLSKHDPDLVRRYVADTADRLSGLSRREALKHLDRQAEAQSGK